MGRFTQALDRKLEDVKRPPNLPVGHYIWQVEKHPEMDEIESKKTGETYDRVIFQMRCVGASDDVDPDELKEYGNPVGALQRKTFMFGDSEADPANYQRSEFRLRQFLEHLGVDPDLTFWEAFPATVGMQCLGEITHRPDPNDPEVIYSEIGRTAAV